MTKPATTIDEQIDLLKERGLTIQDEHKAREILLDIGYYRLGFYLFPFEKSFPNLSNRTHDYFPGATFEDAVNLYYFDFDLRLLLLRYLTRIEIAFCTALVYNLSNKYRFILFSDFLPVKHIDQQNPIQERIFHPHKTLLFEQIKISPTTKMRSKSEI